MGGRSSLEIGLALALLCVVGGCTPVTDIDADGADSTADCDDLDSARFPGADERCNGLDDDCDGAVPLTELDFDEDGLRACDGDCNDYNADLDDTDYDLDGWTTCAGDCDDDRALRNPGAVEVCNGADDDCDGVLPLDEQDVDGDGTAECAGDCNDFDPTIGPVDHDGDGYTICEADCDDSDPFVHPGAPEECDGFDQDCDGVAPMHELDLDGDGFAPCEGDCDDTDAATGPFDDDLDGVTGCDGDCDDGDATIGPWDSDGDSFDRCSGDCDDTDSGVYPGAPEGCAEQDNDCDGLLAADEFDGDGDGWIGCADCDDADAGAGGEDEDGDGFTECAGDCDDGVAGVVPGAGDVYGDGLDQNCDGLDGEDFDGDGFPGNADPELAEADCDDLDANATPLDVDGDGTTGCDGDCNDVDPSVFPDAAEVCDDGIDSDCEGDLNLEVDDDGDGASECAGDCDDSDPALSPLLDADGDGWSPCGDCDDADPDRHPGIWEDATDAVDEDCDGTTATSLPLGALTLTGGGTYFGFDTSCGGDIDGDGLPDFAVSAFGTDLPGLDNVGAVHVYAGGGLPAPGTSTSGAGAATSTIVGEFQYQVVGFALDAAGDFDGDGRADVVVSALGDTTGGYYAGAVALFWGSSLSAGGEFNFGDADRLIAGSLDWEQVGNSIAVLDDLDGDGSPELAIGAAASMAGGLPDGGRVYVFLSSTIVASSSPLEVLDADFIIDAESANTGLGGTVEPAGDLDGDGLGDLVVRAQQTSNVYVFTGAQILQGGSTTTATAHAEILAVAPSTFAFGRNLLGGGDIDGDGLADVVISDQDRPSPELRGMVQVFLGADLATGGTFASTDSTIDLLGQPGDQAGAALAWLPDRDGDGLDDLVASSPYSDEPAVNSGRVSVLSSTLLTSSGPLAAAEVALLGAPGSRTGTSICVAGDLDGDGISEILVSALAGDERVYVISDLP